MPPATVLADRPLRGDDLGRDEDNVVARAASKNRPLSVAFSGAADNRLPSTGRYPGRNPYPRACEESPRCRGSLP
jgi:hypothetical protein